MVTRTFRLRARSPLGVRWGGYGPVNGQNGASWEPGCRELEGQAVSRVGLTLSDSGTQGYRTAGKNQSSPHLGPRRWWGGWGAGTALWQGSDVGAGG